MMVAMLLYALMLPTVVGFLFVVIFTRLDERQSNLERALLGFGIGTGLLTFEMFIIGLCHIQFTMFLFSAVQAATFFILLFLLFKRKASFNQNIGILPYKRGELSNKKMPNVHLAVIALLSIWTFLKILFVIYEGSIQPIFWWDSMAHWSSGAKFFYYNKGLVLQQFNEHFFGRGYRGFLEYPLHIPLLQVWISLCIGNFHEVYVKSFTVIYFLCIIGLVFFAVKREASTTTALLVAFFLSTVPLLTYHSYEAYADLPLSYYALCAAIYFQRYMIMIEINKSNDNGYLLQMGTALAIGSWTKGEGILFTVAFSFAVLFYHVRKRSTLQGSWINLVHYCIPIFIMAIPWYLFVFSNNISTGRGHENFLATSLHFEVLSVFVEQIIFSANFNVIFIFLLPLLLFGWKPIIQSDLKYLMLPLFAVIVFFIVIYLTTDNYIFVVERTAIDRNVLTFIPTMYYISALAAIKILNHFRQ